MKRMVVVVLVIATGAMSLPLSGAARPSGWVGSRYDRSDCTLTFNSGRPSLLCEKRFVVVRDATQEIFVADEACAPSGLRLVRRSGTLEESFLGFDLYVAPVPLPRFNIAGNETDFTERWLVSTTTDLGCL